MYVLGIETSCDETAAAIISNGRDILSNTVASSLVFHKRYGGIVPEIAFRMQIQTIAQVVESAVKKSRIRCKDIELVSVTNGPGLLGSLIVGISFAKAISLGLGIPILGINHLYGHIYSCFLRRKMAEFPFVSLIISGGHTSLFYVQDFDQIKILGKTLDDACGEAFDKVAKILNLGYPGGPIIEQLSNSGNPRKIKFNCSHTKNPLDFSFSGLKTAVLYYVRRQGDLSSLRLEARETRDIAASFQETVINTLIAKSILACKLKKSKMLMVGGGVAANNALRLRFEKELKAEGLECCFPGKEFCMDNAAMVAGLGYHLFKKGYKSGLGLNVDLN